jgi:hypothetical protein
MRSGPAARQLFIISYENKNDYETRERKCIAEKVKEWTRKKNQFCPVNFNYAPYYTTTENHVDKRFDGVACCRKNNSTDNIEPQY